MNPWDSVLLKLENNLPSEEYGTWFQPATYVRHTSDSLTIKVPNKLFSSVIRERYYDDIISALSDIGYERTAIEILDSDESADVGNYPQKQYDEKPTLNPRYTFGSFVVGNSNELAHAAIASVAENPGKRYNPLFIYGGVGLGKTHLMQAAGNEIIKSRPGLRVAYMSSESFINDLISSIRFDRTYQFRSRYRNIDVLMIDDIQFLAGKERTQEEFFHTFNALHDAHKQIIISSDRQPREIPTLEERLRSRFEWGLIADIQPPEFETKIAILQRKAEEEGASLPEDVAALIARRVRSNIRELEGCLIRLVFYSSLTGREIGLKMAEDALADLLEPSDRVITIDEIQARVAEYYSISTRELTSSIRTKNLTRPRQVAMYLCKQLTPHSLPEIGGRFGGKHHSTVIHSLRKIEGLRKEDESLNSLINNLVSVLS
ncbi:MAG TPA: chromosomal replication initiator protein DnaA [Acidobacteriota bacterium]|nr:chromosomal replication initiator protein DnaA [Acidobacteriota bacterium]